MSRPGLRALVVERSVRWRQAFVDVLGADGRFDAVTTAMGGTLALRKARGLADPLDVVLLDLAVDDALHAVGELAAHPDTRVFGLTEPDPVDAQRGIDAIAAGATDCLIRDTAADPGMEIRNRLLPKLLEGVARTIAAEATPDFPVPVPVVPALRPIRHVRPEVLVVGASTGGPNALAAFLRGLGGDCPVPVLLVQHMPASFTGLLARRLDGECQLTVREAANGQPLEPGLVLLAPGDQHLALRSLGPRLTARLHQEPPVHSCRPAVDVLFDAAASHFGAATLGVVLTGMGQDGLAGSRRIVEVGGGVLVQDEASSVVWGMPGQVARAGLATEILPLGELAAAVLARLGPSLPIGAAVSVPGRGSWKP